MYFYFTLKYMFRSIIKKPFHSSLTHKQLPHMSADIKQLFSPTLTVIRYKLLKNIRHNHIYIYIYIYIYRSTMQYNLKIQGFGSVMLYCSMTSRVTTQPSVTSQKTHIFSDTSVTTSTSYGYKLIYISKDFDVVNMPYIKIIFF